MSAIRRKLRPAVALAVCAGVTLVGAVPAATAAPPEHKLGDKLARKVKLDNLNRHLIAFQRHADANGGTRVASSDGYNASVDYLARHLEAKGFDVTRQEFPFVYSETLAESLTAGGEDVPITIMSYSPSTPEGGITAPLAAIEPDDTPGCEAADYGDVTGQIALVSRGACSFAQKQAAAADAGAVATIVYNNEPGALNGTLGDPEAGVIPTGGVAQEDSEALIALDGSDVTLDLRAFQEDRTTYNLIAETTTGRDDNVVMAGAHLDSVGQGAGINDNGTGSAALLETALQLGGSPKVENKVRFAWWGAEEFGLVGSTYYVNNLSFEQQLDIALYLNFDMVGSPNAGYFVYDGDDSDGVGEGAGPYGSAQIEQSFVGYLENTVGVPTEGSDFTGRSDYGEFISVGIPAGGLFTGAEVVKTEEQAAKWGGEAGVPYDPCYHQACDHLGNVDRTALDRNSDAVAWVTAKYAMSTEEVNGVAPGNAKNDAKIANQRAGARTMAAEADHEHRVPA